ncbi:hypothetical protein GW750_06795 [bacterium]|nr:hypothetical protein [bacterium]
MMLLTQANRFNTLNSFVRDISKLSSVAYDDYLAFISYYITNETQQQSQEELFVFYEEFLRQCKIDPIFEQKVRNREVMKDIYYTISHQ